MFHHPTGVLVATCLAIALTTLSSCNASLLDSKGGPLQNSTSDEQSEVIPGTDFEFYILAMSWTAGFCCISNKEQCNHLPGSFAATNQALHGLWPQYAPARHGARWPEWCGIYSSCKNGARPDNGAHCVGSERTKNAWRSRWLKWAPGFVYDNYFLADHEYNKHGSCTVFDRDTYYAENERLQKLIGTPSYLKRHIGTKVSFNNLRNAFGAKRVGLQCSRKGALTGSIYCFSKLRNGYPGKQISCPKSVLNHNYSNGCKNYNEVALPQPGQCSLL